MNTLTTNLKLFEKYHALQHEYVTFAAYIDPPALTQDINNDNVIVTQPEGWNPKALDDVIGMPISVFRSEGTITHSAFDLEGGLAVAGKLKLSQAVESEKGSLAISITSLCPTIEYYPLRSRKNKVIYCENTRVGDVQAVFGGGGCNGMGCIVYPKAERFSKLLANYRQRDMKDWDDQYFRATQFKGRPKLTEEKIKALFPTLEVSPHNRFLEKLIDGRRVGKHGKFLHNHNEKAKISIASRMQRILDNLDIHSASIDRLEDVQRMMERWA